jgi:hypothetical protein
VKLRAGLRDELAATLAELAAFGEKRAGTAAGARAADFLAERMSALGLADVERERFAFPRHDLNAAALAVQVAGTTRDVPFEVLEASGAGDVSADVVHVGWATDEQLAATPPRGRIALVERNPLFHRSTQYQAVAAAGALAMITVSTAPANLRQVGSVRRAWEAIGPIPALSIGATDGHILRAALAANQPVRARVSVQASVSRATGQNVVGLVPGREPQLLVVGAHFDTWFAGASDNGGGVAAMLALAARRAARRPGRYGVRFVAWDGEELALYGGYHFLRRRLVVAGEPILAVIDFETPSALGAQAYGLARSNQAPLEDAIIGVGLHELFAMNVPMDLVPELFGGVIPTDIQGLYRGGTPSVATAVDAPYYHTVEDTPDKVDLERLEETVLAFDRALDALMTAPPERFAPRDPALWRTELRPFVDGRDLVIEARVRDGAGRPRAAELAATLFHDDFFERATVAARADAAGAAELRFAGEAASGDGAPRFVHVTAGERYPLVESVIVAPTS